MNLICEAIGHRSSRRRGRYANSCCWCLRCESWYIPRLNPRPAFLLALVLLVVAWLTGLLAWLNDR